jgi:hypothetical protein
VVNPHEAEWELAAPWLARHPDVTARILSEVGRDESRWQITPGFLEAVWNPELVPVAEEMIRADNPPMGPDSRRVLTEFLTKKTGREYTYVDVDGTARKGGDRPE